MEVDVESPTAIAARFSMTFLHPVDRSKVFRAESLRHAFRRSTPRYGYTIELQELVEQGFIDGSNNDDTITIVLDLIRVGAAERKKPDGLKK
jgi:hypothetical protein